MGDKTMMVMQEITEQLQGDKIETEIKIRAKVDQHLQTQIDTLTPNGIEKLANKKVIAPDEYLDFPDHADDQQNPHNVTAEQAGTYTKSAINQKIATVENHVQELRDETDSRHGAIINLGYTKGYWYGRRNTSTPWPMPADGETWAAHSRKAFDFETNTVWEWDGAEWVEGAQLPVNNGTTIGISESILDIIDSGFPGKCIYSAQTASWDFYPDKLGMEAIRKAIVPPGRPEYSMMRNEADLSKFGLMPADGRTISVHDSRAERLLQYCLIPHAEAVANPDIIGGYLTNDYYPDHASWVAAGKPRATPAEDGAYFAIPDGCGLFLRGAGANGGHKPSVNALYDGKDVGSFNPHKTGSHNHGFYDVVAGRWSNNLVYGFAEGGSTHYALVGDFHSLFTGDDETAGAWLAALFVISY